jgi:hypothetical protein
VGGLFHLELYPGTFFGDWRRDDAGSTAGPMSKEALRDPVLLK